MVQGWTTGIDFLEFDADPSTSTAARPQLAIKENKAFPRCLGQPVNVVTGTVTNQWVGTLAIPAIAINVVGTVTLTNSLITANSFIMLSARKVGTDAATGRGPSVFVDALSAGSATIGIKATTVAIAVNIWVVHYLIIN